MNSNTRRFQFRPFWCLAIAYFIVACVANTSYTGSVQRWWTDRGPVVRHDSFPADCTLCHLEGSWNEIRPDFEFDHLAETGHALEGAHASAECLRCHNDRGPVQLFAQRGCSGCHEDLHRGQLGPTCDSCHGQESWGVYDFITEHNATRFPLVGAHAAAACWSCHPGAQVGEFTRLDPDCASCHQEALTVALDPDHEAAGWVTGCDRCHLSTQWSSASGFPHSGFALTGAHAAADCSQCHVGAMFQGTPTDCFTCHQTEFQATTSPNHVMSGIGMNCDQCHSTLSWIPAAFNHTWMITGAHVPLSCVDCHGGGVYQGTPTDCASCHQAEYNATSMPDHGASGFGMDCESCHSTLSWTPAAFNHSWPITGAHIALDCTACHGGGVYVGTPTDCFSCHQTDYNATSMPNHAMSGFGNMCETCHTTNAWVPATFNHSFPTTGQHNLNCIDCHTTNMPPAFSCIDCHEHTLARTTKQHEDENVNGFMWVSSACLACHPDGND